MSDTVVVQHGGGGVATLGVRWCGTGSGGLRGDEPTMVDMSGERRASIIERVLQNVLRYSEEATSYIAVVLVSPYIAS